MSKRVLVTGGAGFVGSHVVDELLEAGYEVTVYDSLVEQVHDGTRPEYLPDDAEFVGADIRDRDALRSALEDADVVNHQASAVGVAQSMYEIEHYVDVNSRGTATLLDLLINDDVDVEKMIVASSMTIYGESEYHCPDCDSTRHPGRRTDEQMQSEGWEVPCPECGCDLEPQPTPESKPLNPTSVYAVTKRDQEDLCLSVSRAYDIPTVALRYFNIYGSRQSLDNPYTGVCAIFSSRIKNDNPPVVFEDGKQTRDFVHVSDVARANRLAIEREEANYEVINVGSGTPQTIGEVANSLIRAYGKEEKIEPEFSGEFRTGDIRHSWADTTRARELLDFEPTVEFEEGIRRLVVWGAKQASEDSFGEAYEELQQKGLMGDE